jgi:hypothetical protein
MTAAPLPECKGVPAAAEGAAPEPVEGLAQATALLDGTGPVEPPSAPALGEAEKAAPDSEVPPAMVDRSLQAQLGQQLRALFDHVAAEPVPDRLLKLLEQLEDKEKQR